MLSDRGFRGALIRRLPTLLLVAMAGAWSHDVRAQPAAPALRMNGQFIAAPEPGTDRAAWLTEVNRYRERMRQGTAGTALDRSNYARPDLAWAAGLFACHFTFMYDRAFYDPLAGQYALASFLDDGAREFGGYQAIVLWQAYPRIGIDQRNQFDLYSRHAPAACRDCESWCAKPTAAASRSSSTTTPGTPARGARASRMKTLWQRSWLRSRRTGSFWTPCRPVRRRCGRRSTGPGRA